MKKYIVCLFISTIFSCGVIFGSPEEHDTTFQTVNPAGTTNANIAANGNIFAVAAVPGGKILIGGDFTMYKGQTVNRIARLNSDGTLDTSFNPLIAPLTNATLGFTGGSVNVIALVPGGTSENYSFIVGGNFTKFNNVSQVRLAKINCTATGCALDTNFVSTATTDGANAAVNTLAFVPGSTSAQFSLIIGGSFTKMKNLGQKYLSKINCTATTCAVDTKLVGTATTTGPNAAVNTLAFAPEGTLDNYSLFIGGAFTTYNGSAQKYISKIDCTATACPVDSDFFGTGTIQGASAAVNTIVVAPNYGIEGDYNLLIGGAFTKFNNINQRYFSRFRSSNNSVDTDFVGTATTNGANGIVETIVLYDNGVSVIGGAFTTFNGIPRNHIAQFSSSGELDNQFNTIPPYGADSVVQNLLIEPDGKIVVVGLFDGYNGLFAGRIVRIRGMTSAGSVGSCSAGLTYCGFQNSCLPAGTPCNTCPADFVLKGPTIAAESFTPAIVPAPGTWSTITPGSPTTLAQSPTAHFSHAMVALGTKIYVFGGYTNTSTEVYDTMTNTWQTLAPYPGATSPYGIMAAVYNGKIYTFYEKKTYEYDPANNTWTQKSDIPTSKRTGSAEVIDGKIYIVSSLADYKLHIYDPLLDTWSAGPDLPISSHYAESAVLEGKLYILGGTSGAHGTHKQVHVYDSCTKSWRRITDMASVRAIHNVSAVQGELYVGGGVTVVDRDKGVLKTFIKYDPLSGVTTTLPDMPFSSYHTRSVAIGHLIYALGGAGINGKTTESGSDKTKNFVVYNTGATNITVDNTISACYCRPMCGAGKYFCAAENACKPANQTCGTVTCNKNGVCDAGESCNCADCNGEADHCGLSGGKQMICSDAGIPPATGTTTCPYPNVTTTTYTIDLNARSNDVVKTKTITNLLPGTHEFTGSGKLLYCTTSNCGSISGHIFVTTNPKNYIYTKTHNQNTDLDWDVQKTIVTTTNQKLQVTAGQAYLKGTLTVKSTTCLPTPAQVGACCPEGKEWDTVANDCVEVKITCSEGEYWCSSESTCKSSGATCGTVICNNNNTCDIGESCNCADCTNGGEDDADKCGLANGEQMVCTKDMDNATVLGGFNSLTAQANFDIVNNKLATHLSSPGNLNVATDASFTPTATELKITQDTQQTPFFISFTQQEAWTRVKELLSIPASAQVLWSTSSIKYENDSIGDNERYLYSYVIQQTSGVQKQILFATEYLPAYGWRKVYIIGKDYPLSTTATGTEVCQNFVAPRLFGNPLAELRSPAQFCLEQGFRGTNTVINTTQFTGWLTQWNAAGTGWEPNQNGIKIDEIRCCGIPSNAGSNTVQVGACCPAGSQWSSAQNKCVLQCQPIVTLKKGSDLTTVKNAAGEVFSANTTCANKQISLAPCTLTSGVVQTGTSASGNKLYNWPKSFSGLSKDYNLVEIKGQCWFADNLEEKPSNVPTPPGVWENTSPHNDYGLYSYTGTGVNRPEGFLYQFDAATNMVAPGGAPADRQKGVCPAGWHVATDCEFQYIEHALGMSVAEQQAVGVSRTSGAVGTALKTGGNSGFDMSLSGARRWNSGGFINGGSEGHLWSSECTTGGCYKRILDATGTVRRLVGDGGTYDASHHAAGSVRCVQDGSTTPVNSCVADKCGEGQYFCSSENKCMPAGQTCGTVTCNNNSVCDINESCDCADCNEMVDHCGIDGSGQQMVCTKDTIPTCYTDKFPYCLPACLNGFKYDATVNKCIPGGDVKTYFGGMYGGPGYNNPTTGAQSCPAGYVPTKISGTPNLDYSLYLCTRKVSDTSTAYPTQYFDFGGMYGDGGTPSSWTLQNNPFTGAKTCPAGYTSTQVLGADTVDYPLNYCWKTRATAPTLASEDFGGMWGMQSVAPDIWLGAEYNNPITNAPTCPSGYNPILTWGTDNVDWLLKWCHKGTSVTPTVGNYIKRVIDNNSNRAIATCQAGEVLVGGGCENYSGGAFFVAGFPIVANESWTLFSPTYDPDFFHSSSDFPGTFTTPLVSSQAGYACSSGYAGTNVRAVAICATSGANTIIRKGTIAANAAIAQCQAGEVRIGGGCRYVSGGPYFHASRPMNKNEVQYGLTATEDAWACAGSTDTQIEARVICRPPVNGQTINVRSASDDYHAYCNEGEQLIGGGCQAMSGAYFYKGVPLLSGGVDPYGAPVTKDQFFCTSGSSYGTNKAYAICVSPQTPNSTSKIPYSQTLTLSGTSGNNNHLFEKIATLPPGEYTFSGSGTSYNDGGGGTNMVFFSEKDINLSNPDNMALAPDGFDRTKYGAATGACPEVVYYQGPSDPYIVYAVKRCGYETKQWIIPTGTKVVSQKNIYLYRYLSQSAVAGTININGFSYSASCFTPPANYTPSPTPPALPATAKYQSKSLLADGTVNDGIYSYLGGTFPCDNCSYPTLKTGQTNPITFKIPSTAGLTGQGKYYAFDIINNTVFINMCFDNVNLRIFFDDVLKHSFTTNRISINAWGMRIIPDPQKPGYGWVGTRKNTAYDRYSLVLDNDNSSYENWQYITLPSRVKFDYVGTITDRCPGQTVTGGSWQYYYGFIADADFDATKIATSALPLCQSETTTTNTGTTITPSNTGIQIGACCPAGSAWNSVEKRCVPTTCGEGKFYCAAQKKCLNGGEACDTDVCKDDGVCSGEESCQCTDCVNGGSDDKDKCGIVGGIQAMCSDDNLTDDKPGACCVAPKKWNSATRTCAECTNTQAPSEVKAGVDQPYITCNGNGDTSKTHFRYKITKTNSAETPFVSEIKSIGTSVLHSTLPEGNYTVECFYGNVNSVDAAGSPDTCTKTVASKSSAQGCSRVYPYRSNTLSNEMTATSTFQASFRCGSRLPQSEVTNPYILRFASESPAYLQYDTTISTLFQELAIGPISTQTNNYSFPLGTTNVSCAVKVGGGYSTNSSCQIRACAGGECSVPQTFSVVHSANALCTTTPEDNYNIGCNPDAPQSSRDSCVKWFNETFAANGNKKSFTIPFIINNQPRNIDCNKYDAGSMPGGLNMLDYFVCTTKLPNGETVELYSGDKSLQTTAYTVKFDNEKPKISDIRYYTDNTLSTRISNIKQWQKNPVVAEVTCTDTPTEETLACACSKTVHPSSTQNTAWSQGVPDSVIGADLMRYTRTFGASVTGQSVRVNDTALNQSEDVKAMDVYIDNQVPLVNLTITGTGTTKNIVINASDSLSKIWKTVAAPDQSTNANGIIYRKVPKATVDVALFDQNCNLASGGQYALVDDTSVQPTAQTASIPLNVSNESLIYCVQDNAGNVTRGVYPSDITGCFSATNMSPVPTLSTYQNPLQTNITAGKYGYSLSEDQNNATCFRGILSSNISTLITNQYNANANTSLLWSQPATLKNTTTANTNGYYYHSFTTTTNTNNTVTLPTTNPTGTGQKVVVVDGGNIQINSNIDYAGTDKTLVLIARKNASGTAGGNIYINPSVTRIDAILIADGSLINATTTNGSATTSTTTTKNWIDNEADLSNRLIINGRIYSFNTRGGSLTNDLKAISGNTGRYFELGTLKTDGTPSMSASMDLEGFRVLLPEGQSQCSLHVNYRALTSASIPPILRRPSSYTGGACTF